MFKRFFGIPERGASDGLQDFWEAGNFDRPGDTDPFRSVLTEPNEMFQHFEDILKGFGFNYEEKWKTDDEPNVTIQERMLKEPDEKRSSPSNELILTDPWSRFWSMPNFSEDRSHFQDIDLDVDVSKQGLENVLTDRKEELSIERPQNGRSFFRSTAVTKIVGPDGKIEERCTKSDGHGNEETIVTRIVGDRSHSVITRKDKSGIEEQKENFVNLDEKNLEDFHKEWSNHSKDSLPQLYGGDATAPKLFSNLFEKFLPLKKPDI